MHDIQTNVIMDSNRVLDIFREITRIPRESGHEEKIRAYLQNFAKEHNLDCRTDAAGNVLITKEASQGKENVPAIALQSHQDMVCEKVSGSAHDFSRDPVEYVEEDGWMTAKETTLGADDGIGIAASLALLSSDLEMGKVECLFTVSEETGMDGANALQPGFFTARTLLNLDSEDEGQLFIGCAGGIDTTGMFRYSRVPSEPGSDTLKFKIFNAIGGHSGDDINKERANAILLMARFLYSEMGKYQLIMFRGGNKRNAIARDAEAVLSVPAGEIYGMMDRFSEYADEIKGEFHVSDPDLKFEAKAYQCTEKPVSDDVAMNFVMSLMSVHHGVVSMSQDIPGLVETSGNLAAVDMSEEGRIVVKTSQRSSVESAKKFIADKVEASFRLAGAEVTHSDPYPGWKPDMNSHILKVAKESYRRLFGTDPEVKAIHAGLECGLFLTKFPYLDMISFGPTLRGVHAPGERLDLASNDRFVRLLVDIVTNFS